MKKKIFIASLVICGIFLLPSQGNAINLMESLFLKITIVENGMEHEWEYTSPGKYEYEHGEKVIKTKEAKEEMLALVKMIQLSERAQVNEMVAVIKKEKFPNIERLDIRWMNGESKLYTWVWDNEKE